MSDNINRYQGCFKCLMNSLRGCLPRGRAIKKDDHIPFDLQWQQEPYSLSQWLLFLAADSIREPFCYMTCFISTVCLRVFSVLQFKVNHFHVAQYLIETPESRRRVFSWDGEKEKEDNQRHGVQEMLCCAQIPQKAVGVLMRGIIGKEQASRSVASALFDKREAVA